MDVALENSHDECRCLGKTYGGWQRDGDIVLQGVCRTITGRLTQWPATELMSSPHVLRLMMFGNQLFHVWMIRDGGLYEACAEFGVELA